jgi:hypothetical protein
VCRAPIDDRPQDDLRLLEDLVSRTLPPEAGPGGAADETYFLIVGRGHRDLLEQVKGVLGDTGWVRVIEDRRRDATLLPREGRGGKVFTIE